MRRLSQSVFGRSGRDAIENHYLLLSIVREVTRQWQRQASWLLTNGDQRAKGSALNSVTSLRKGLGLLISHIYEEDSGMRMLCSRHHLLLPAATVHPPVLTVTRDAQDHARHAAG
jgi:hypothetical protein